MRYLKTFLESISDIRFEIDNNDLKLYILGVNDISQCKKDFFDKAISDKDILIGGEYDWRNVTDVEHEYKSNMDKYQYCYNAMNGHDSYILFYSNIELPNCILFNSEIEFNVNDNELLNESLSEKDFYNKYVAIHKDLQSKGDVKDDILKNGFHEGVNVNALPFYKGCEFGTDIISRKFRPRNGDFVWLLPKEGVIDAPNGYKTKGGYIPSSEDGFFIIDEEQSVYWNYLQNLK